MASFIEIYGLAPLSSHRKIVVRASGAKFSKNLVESQFYFHTPRYKHTKIISTRIGKLRGNIKRITL